ncbi:putative wall-associated receptor kinase-like 16 [Castanea sativa]|uniref:putative wall-associated receptor kinase-like 16 n=1 Tax=Castanea sativa TaxID=21020 RepID=UPI003F64EE72
MDFQYQRMLIQVTWVGVILSLLSAMAAAATEYPLALPGCPKKCGDVKIPYPFGLTEECRLKDTSGRKFLLTCNSTSGQLKPFSGNAEVTNISIHGEMEILMYNAVDCYDQPREQLEWQKRLRSGNYTISDTQNKFVAIGCDTYAYLRGYKNDKLFSMGCLSVCQDKSNVVSGSCSGIGCCEMDIPKGLKNITLEAYSFKNHTEVWDFNPCSFAFVIQGKKFNFSSDYLYSLRRNETFPMVLDWAIGNETCEVAQNKANYVCGWNTRCEDPNNGSGYRCNCTNGYSGNPYLKDGCKDVDECEELKHNCTTDTQFCVNQPGSFRCECKEGYHLDGVKCVHQTSGHSLRAIDLGFGAGIGLIVMLVCCSWLYLIVKQRNLTKVKEKFFKQNGGFILQQQHSRQENSTETVKIFTTEELKKATNNYDETLIIGRGGFGIVYKGFLPDNKMVAIKKSKIVDQSQMEQFINEVIVLSQINHRNVVKLLGCCLETSVPLLVYEFIPNGTLFEYIHSESKVSTISWEICLRIATETAEALSYLHSAASTPIIHRDVKSSNILLDSSYTAKVSDFGASRLVPLDQAEVATMVQGTIGYLDPEYLHTSQLTEKSDVYSFGVVLVELLTGRKALSFDKPEVERSLVTYFLLSFKENRLFEILEKYIANEGNAEQLKEVANLAKKCLSLKGEDRPTMKDVAMELEGLRKMEKHSWVNINSNFEETEHLIAETSDSSKYDVRSKSIEVYDSVRDHVLLDFDDGR